MDTIPNSPETNLQKTTPQGSSWSIPLAIVIAGALIAGAVFFSGAKNSNIKNGVNVQKDIKVKPVSKEDHIIGNPNAPVVIVEYSDLQCPYCAVFDKTMKQVIESYGKDGKVAWVYRHFWSERKDSNGNVFHPLAGKAAEASECVAELGGNEKFWAFNTKIFEGQSQGSLSKLSENAVAVGVEKTAFDSCLSSGKYAEKVAKDFKEGREAGVTGTPNSFIITKKGITPIPGALSFSSSDPTEPGMKQIIDEIIDSL